jgi:hypothetical protein
VQNFHFLHQWHRVWRLNSCLHGLYFRIFTYSPSNLLALQSSAGLGLLRGNLRLLKFRNSNSSGVGSLAPRPTPNLENQGMQFVSFLSMTCQAWTALPGAYALARIALWVTGARKPPLHDKAAVLEEEFTYLPQVNVGIILDYVANVSMSMCVWWGSYLVSCLVGI